MELRFTHIGFSHIICANKVKLVIPPHLITGRRYIKRAKDAGLFIDATCGRQMKSIILMDDGAVIGCSLNPKTAMGRLASVRIADDWEDDSKNVGEVMDD